MDVPGGAASDAVPFTLRGMRDGVRDTLPVAVSDFAVSLAFGVLASKVGLTLPETVLMSALVFAGAAQFIALGIWAAPVPIGAILLTTLIVNLRHLLMGAALRPWFERLSPSKAYGSIFFMVDETWALTMRRISMEYPDRAFLLGGGLTLFVAWVGATALGRIVGAVIRHPDRLGLDFAITAVFIALLVGLWRGRGDLLPWAAAGVAAVVSARLLPGTWYIVVGGVAGSVTGAVRDAR